MAHVQDVVRHKGSEVLTIGPHASTLAACILMNDHQIGALVVIDPARYGRQVHGIITERDVLRRVVAQRRDPAQTRVGEVMTRDVVVCRRDTEIHQARSLIMDRRVRHLPVVDDHGQLEGLISIGDLNAWDLTGQEIHIQALEEYLYGLV